jgi:hypothetical protein
MDRDMVQAKPSVGPRRNGRVPMKFLIESSHTKAECLQALDDILAKGPDVLNKFEFGCNSGVHTAWGTVEGRNESEVRNMLPASIRDKARLVEISRFTPEQIRSFHQK